MSSPSQPTKEQVSELLGAMHSDDDKARSVAYQRWFEFHSRDKIGAVRAVMVQAAENPAAPARKMATVLLRSLLDSSGDGKEVAQKLPGAGLSSLQKMLLSRMNEEPDESVAAGIQHLIGNLAAILVTPDDERSAGKLDLRSRWPDLLPFLGSGCNSPKPASRARSFQLLATIVGYLGGEVADRLVGSTARAIQAGVSDSDVSVKVAAAIACVTLMSETSSVETAKPMLGALPAMFGVLREAISRDEQAGSQVMQALVELAGQKPSIFAPPAFQPAVRASLEVASTASFEPQTRKAGLELPVQLCVCADHMVRKAPAETRAAILQCACRMASEVDDDEDWAKENDVETNFYLESDPSPVVDAGLDAIQRVTLSLKGRVLLAPIVQITDRLMKSGNWKERYAGLAVLGLSSNGCADQLIKNPTKALAPFVSLAKSDPHPRVRYIAYQGIAAMIDALSADSVKSAVPFHQQVHKALYPYLCDAVAAKENKAQPRVHGAAVYALRQFVIVKVKEHHITPPERAIVPLVDAVRSSPRANTKQFALQAISLMITNAMSKATCTSIYSKLMPVLRSSLGEARKAKAETGEDMPLVDRVLEVVGTLISNVREDVAGKDASQVMKLVEPSLARKSCSPGTYRMAHMTAVRISMCVGEKFKPFLPRIIPGLVETAKSEIPMFVTTSPEYATVSNPSGSGEPFTRVVEMKPEAASGGAAAGGASSRSEAYVQTIIPGSTRAVAYSRDAMEEKESAVYTLFMYASNLVESMFPFAGTVAQTAAALLGQKIGPNIRSLAAPMLVKCAYIAAKDPRGPSYSQPMFVRMVQSLVGAIDGEKDVDVLPTLLESLAGMCRLCWRLRPTDGSQPSVTVPEDALDKVFTTMGTVFQLSNDRREQLHLHMRDHPEEVDPETLDFMRETSAKEDEIIQAVTEVTEALLKVHGSKAFGAVRAHLVPQLPKLFGKHDMPDVQYVAVSVLDALFDFAGPEAFGLLPKVFEDMKKFAGHQHPDLRQCAAYGLGLVAEKGPPDADKVMPAIVGALRSGLSLDCARADEEQSRSTDNVVSSLLRVVRYRSKAPGVDAGRILKECILPNLPATDCPTESKIIHGWVLRAIEAKDGQLLAAAGGGASGATRLLQLLAMMLGEHHVRVLLSDVEYEGGEEVGTEVDEEDIPGILFASDLPLAKRCVDALMGGLPKEAVQAVLGKVPPPVQELLKDPSQVRDPEALIGAIHGEF